MSFWVLSRSYQRAPWADDTARLVVHCSTHFWCDRRAILDAFLARVGYEVATYKLFEMIGGTINLGRPVANLYVCV